MVADKNYNACMNYVSSTILDLCTIIPWIIGKNSK